jgi:hypothetical protein
LSGVEAGEVEPEAIEPPVPPGLGRLSAALKEFAEFFRVDPVLIEVAAAASGKSLAAEPAAEELGPWVAELPAAEKDSLLVRLMRGEGTSVAGELLRRFRTDTTRAKGAGAGPARRTVEELLAARDRRAEEKQRRAAERAVREKERRAREGAAARAHHLDAMTGREEDLWRLVEVAVGTKKAGEYDRAIELLEDLRDLAARAGTGDELARRVGELRERHRTKTALIARLNRAGLRK